jgi:glutamate racemase
LIHQPEATADALERYLARHPELDPGRSGARTFLTTGEPGVQNGHVAAFWGAPVMFESADLPAERARA